MKNTFTKSALVLAAGLIAGSAFAAGTQPSSGEGQISYVEATRSTLTREEVKAQYFAARQAGALPLNGEGQEMRVAVTPSVLSREAVKAEYFAARKAGKLPLNGERG